VNSSGGFEFKFVLHVLESSSPSEILDVAVQVREMHWLVGGSLLDARIPAILAGGVDEEETVRPEVGLLDAWPRTEFAGNEQLLITAQRL